MLVVQQLTLVQPHDDWCHSHDSPESLLLVVAGGDSNGDDGGPGDGTTINGQSDWQTAIFTVFACLPIRP